MHRSRAQAGKPSFFLPRCASARAAAVLPGYFQGKKRAEDALAAAFPTSGVALRPGFIQGTRYVAGIGIPLQLVGAAGALL